MSKNNDPRDLFIAFAILAIFWLAIVLWLIDFYFKGGLH